MAEASGQAQTHAAPAPRQNSPGAYLRQAREAQGLSHAAVGQALHLTIHYIKALENDEYGKLPGLTFVKGYLRTYARLLGVNVEGVLARFEDHISSLLDEGSRSGELQRSRRLQDQAQRWAVGAGCVLVLGLGGGWWYVSSQQSQTPQPVTVVQSRAPVQPAPVPPVAADLSPVVTEPASATEVAIGGNTVETVAAMPGDAELSAAIVTGDPGGEDAPVLEGDTTTVDGADGTRQVTLLGSGDDLLQMQFNGNSWVEIDDGQRVRLYNDMLRAGDALTIRGEAPFYILLGDATQVEVLLNSTAVDIAADIRSDSTARVVLENAGPGEGADF